MPRHLRSQLAHNLLVTPERVEDRDGHETSGPICRGSHIDAQVADLGQHGSASAVHFVKDAVEVFQIVRIVIDERVECRDWRHVDGGDVGALIFGIYGGSVGTGGPNLRLDLRCLVASRVFQFVADPTQVVGHEVFEPVLGVVRNDDRNCHRPRSGRLYGLLSKALDAGNEHVRPLVIVRLSVHSHEQTHPFKDAEDVVGIHLGYLDNLVGKVFEPNFEAVALIVARNVIHAHGASSSSSHQHCDEQQARPNDLLRFVSNQSR
mmetsp:Transcript_6709/g.19628  ORF Transcript_6709/g.19628 Transcript_6709/m.19628 type:complete len:263 (+) Transcript_6709:490-1278(+)